MPSHCSIMAVGEVTIDWLSLEPGLDFDRASKFERALGGSAANLAIACSRLGIGARLVACAGEDFHGQYIKQILTREGVDISHFRLDPNYPTAQSYMVCPQPGRHKYVNWPLPHAADMLNAEDVAAALKSPARFLHGTAVSLSRNPRRNAILQAVSLAKGQDIAVSFDAGLAPEAAPDAIAAAREIMVQADLLKMNEPETLFWAKTMGLSSGKSLDHCAQFILEQAKSVRALFVTMASAGSLIYAGGRCHNMEPVSVPVVSEVGAGDSFMAGVLSRLAIFAEAFEEGKPGLSAAEFLDGLSAAEWQQVGFSGSLCGAMACRSVSSWEGLPQAPEWRNKCGIPHPSRI